MSEHLAKAAYLAYAEAVNWRDSAGQQLPQYSQLPVLQRAAWAASTTECLKAWLANDLRLALQDEGRIMESFFTRSLSLCARIPGTVSCLPG